MADAFAQHLLILKAGAQPEQLKRLFEQEIFQASAEAGPVDRGGHRLVGSQHLLGMADDGTKYLWIVKWSGAFSVDEFKNAVGVLVKNSRDKLDAICNTAPMEVWTQIQSYDAGPRDTFGNPTGPPRRDVPV